MMCVPAFWASADSHWLSATRDFCLFSKTPPPARDTPTHLLEAFSLGYPYPGPAPASSLWQD